MLDLYHNAKVVSCLLPLNRTADADGSAVDLSGYESCLLIAHCGESSDTLASGGAKIEFEVEESADNNTWTDVADSDLFNYVDGANDGCFAQIDSSTEDETVFKTGYRGTKRYVRVVANYIDTHAIGTPVSAVAVLGNPKKASA